MPSYENIDLRNVIMDGDPFIPSEGSSGGGGGGGEGHTYDLVPSSDKSEVTLTEDSVDKTTLPLVATYNGTRANYNSLSSAEQAKYRHIIFTDEPGSDDISGKSITYTSSDTTDGSATSWTSVSKLTSGLSLTTLFARMSQMFKNVRYLYNLTTPTVLWSGDQGNYTGSSSNLNYALNKSYKNYKILRFYIRIAPDSDGLPKRPIMRDISTEQLDWIRTQTTSYTLSMGWGYGSKADYVDIQSTSTDNNLVISLNQAKVQKIEGIKV